MKQFHELCERVLQEGTFKDDRTGVGTYSITGAEIEFDLSEGFPLLGSKTTVMRLIDSELFWFISGSTNIRYLLENNNHIWDEWPFKKWTESAEYEAEGLPDMTDFGLRMEKDPEFKKLYKEVKAEYCRRVLEDDAFSEKFGDIGRAYGAQWRAAYYVNPETLEVSTVDQLGDAIETLKRDPYSRRIIVSSFNPDNVRHAALPCCHHQFQFIVRDGKLDLVWDQRSVDVFLGLPFNIASYALLLEIVAKLVNLTPGKLVGHLKDVHIYSNHLEQVNELLRRDIPALPKLVLDMDGVTTIDEMTRDRVTVVGYDPKGPIKAPVAV